MSARETQTPDIETLLDGDAVRARVAELGRQIESEIGAEDPLLIGLLEGSLIFLSDLVRAIPAPIRFELIQVHSGEDSGVIRIEYPIPVDIAGQSVVVVKDVVASGVTEPYLGQQLRDHGARQVRFAAHFGRNMEYYTGFVFELWSRDGEGPVQVAGGGRYDTLMESLGAKKPVSAIGCALRTERMLVARHFLEGA